MPFAGRRLSGFGLAFVGIEYLGVDDLSRGEFVEELEDLVVPEFLVARLQRCGAGSLARRYPRALVVRHHRQLVCCQVTVAAEDQIN